VRHNKHAGGFLLPRLGDNVISRWVPVVVAVVAVS
jgi:hypothetical protein